MIVHITHTLCKYELLDWNEADGTLKMVMTLLVGL